MNFTAIFASVADFTFQMKTIYAIIAAIAIISTACVDGKSHGGESEPMPIERIDRLVYNFHDMDSAERSRYVDSMSPGLRVYLGIAGVNPDSVEMPIALDVLSATNPVKVFSPDVEKRIFALDEVEFRLGHALESLKSLLPDIRVSHVYGIVSPYRQSVITADSVVLVALNLYLGADYQGYTGFESYFRRLREPERIPYDVAEAVIASNYPIDKAGAKTVLAKMLYQGALVNALMLTFPNAKLSDALGVSSEDLEWFKGHEAEIWDSIITRNLLYSQSDMDAAKLLSPAPATTIINHDAPGRAGRYIGYRIVKAYMDRHSDVTIKWLLSPAFYGETSSLVDAKYSPSK